eukprot:969561_1
MADFVVGIDYLLESDNSDACSDHEETKNQHTNELSSIDLLKSIYGSNEKEIQNKKQQTHKRQPSKLKFKIGSIVEIYSSSRKEWFNGTIKEIKGDTFSISYLNGKKLKWVHKTSSSYRMKPEIESISHQKSNSISQSSTPPITYSSVLIEDELSINNQNIPIHMHAQYPSSSISVSPSPLINEYEYDVTFTTQTLGILLCPVSNGKDAVVTECITGFSSRSIDIGSIISAINGKNVMGLAYSSILNIIKQNAIIPPLTITFKALLNGQRYKQKNSVGERGKLQIKVVACMQLRTAARYVSVKIGKACVNTKILKNRNEHPEWNEVLSFNNFRCDHGKVAIITVYDKSSILKDKKIGSVEYPLPVKFNERKNDTMEIHDDKGRVSGVIMLNAKVVRNKFHSGEYC